MMASTQVLPVRVYQTDDRIMLTAPMPGLEPENIAVRIEGRRVVIDGEERGPHQRDLPLSIAEWAIGPYHRELELPEPVDGALANATYGNGVLVLSMPKVSAGHPGETAEFRLITIAGGRGERVGHIGRNVRPHSTEEHWEGKHDPDARTAVAPRAAGVRRGVTYRRILVPLDGSREAESILPLAEGLVDSLDGDLVLLRVLIPYTAMPLPDVPSPIAVEAAQEVQTEVAEYLSGLAATITARGLRVQCAAPSGDPARRIVDTAREMDVALIAMTTHGRTGLSRVLFGAVAESVVRDAPVPVLLMRASPPDAVRRAA
jgi:HSP20 family protein